MYNQAKVNIEAGSRSKIMQAMGRNTKEFRSKITWLRNKWTSVAEGHRVGDCHEVHVISPVIVGTLTLTNASLISDNLEFFKENYQQPSEVDATLLEQACLCGAEKIVNFLLEKCEDPLKRFPFMLTYVASSPNEEWAKKIALEMRKQEMDIPSGLALFCSDTETVDALTKIFKSCPKVLKT